MGTDKLRSMNTTRIKQSARKTAGNFIQIIPLLTGVLLLVSLAITLIPKSIYQRIFTGNIVLDPLLGATLGSISGGNPLTSYIIGGELLKQGVSLIAVAAFLLSWVTVGIIQLPAEALTLGKKFALLRNCLSFFAAIIIAVLLYFTLKIL